MLPMHTIRLMSDLVEIQHDKARLVTSIQVWKIDRTFL